MFGKGVGGACGAGDAVQAWSRGRTGGWGGEAVGSVLDPNLQGRRPSRWGCPGRTEEAGRPGQTGISAQENGRAFPSGGRVHRAKS